MNRQELVKKVMEGTKKALEEYAETFEILRKYNKKNKAKDKIRMK